MDAVTLTSGNGAVTGFLGEGTPGMPLLVCLPGGSYNARYFDVPGHSFAAAAAARGFHVAVLDRPGYAGSTPLDAPSFAGNAQALIAAVADLWGSFADRSPGVVLVGHSIGGAISVHIGGAPRPWPLLGIAVTAIHVDAPDAVAQAWSAMPAEASIEFSTEQRIQFMYGPAGSYESDVVGAAEPACSPVPVAELLEVVGAWITDFPAHAIAVDVPVHYGLGEHEVLWNSSDDAVRAFGSAFASSPEVTSRYVLGSGHNIDHHLVGPSFQHEQLDWAEQFARR